MATAPDRAATGRVTTDEVSIEFLTARKRTDACRAIDVPAIDFGPAQIVLMPAESFVQYQLSAQRMRPDSFVMVPGYGECAPGYIPTAEAAMLAALREGLQGPGPG